MVLGDASRVVIVVLSIVVNAHIDIIKYKLALVMAVDDPFPPIDEALINRLKELIPEKCPDLDEKDREIWYYSGQRSMVKMLESVYNEQNNLTKD